MSMITVLLLAALLLVGCGMLGYGWFAGQLLQARVRARQQGAARRAAAELESEGG
jgi:hypothetical protein